MNKFEQLPHNLPMPKDDAGARHLPGSLLPKIELACTSGQLLALHELPPLSVLFFYPRTGVPGEPVKLGFAGESWESIPGAQGCTPQCIGFRDTFQTFAERGIGVFGVSTQSRVFQQEFQKRQAIPFHFLSDENLHLTNALNLPTFDFPVSEGGSKKLLKRMAWVVFQGIIQQVWYPVFPPDACAQEVLGWLIPRTILFHGFVREKIRYQLEQTILPDELANVFSSSGISRPTSDAARLGRMLSFSNVTISARDMSGRLIGVLRGLTDFSWCTYVSDLAVTSDHQKQGIGKELLEAAKTFSGPQCTLILNSAPKATTYYPKIGMSTVASAWHWKRTE